MQDKKEIIKEIVDMMRLEDKEILTIVLTEEEKNMDKNKLKAHILNQNTIRNNQRLDEILKVNEIAIGTV